MLATMRCDEAQRVGNTLLQVRIKIRAYRI